ncbi:MAG: nuclear transport factor 2 family protein [Maribacter sp.]
MKKKALVLIIVLACISSSFSQKSIMIKRDLNMYSHVWDDIINKRQISQNNDMNFNQNFTLVASRENIVGIEDNTVFMQQLDLLANPGNLGIIDSAYKAFSVGDIPTVLSKLDPNVVWNEAEGNALADGNPYIGPDAVLNGVFARIGEQHEYFNLKDIVLHEMSNDRVLATLRYDAKYKHNGATYDVQAAHLWTLKDAKVIAFQQYVDTKQLDDALHGGNQTSNQKLLYKTGNPKDWPKNQDAVVSAPKNHKILMENENVRVLEVTLSPNELEPVHHHQWPSVLYIMEAGEFIDRDGEGNIILDTRQMPSPLEFPMTMWKDPEAPHSVENLSPTKPIRLIRVEMKQ